jgi:hypothetical protein
MADLHDRFKRRLVFSGGAWHGEVMHAFDVTRLMREVTLPGADAQQAFDAYMGRVRACGVCAARASVCALRACVCPASVCVPCESVCVCVCVWRGVAAVCGCLHTRCQPPTHDSTSLHGTRAPPPASHHQQLMSEEPLGCDGLPPWDIMCVHYACDPHRSDVVMRASHIIGVYLCARARVYVRVCMRACVLACVRAWLCLPCAVHPSASHTRPVAQLAPLPTHTARRHARVLAQHTTPAPHTTPTHDTHTRHSHTTPTHDTPRAALAAPR